MLDCICSEFVWFLDLGVESSRTESCGTDVEEELVNELEGLVDKTGTTKSTQFSVLHYIFLPFKKRCGF